MLGFAVFAVLVAAASAGVSVRRSEVHGPVEGIVPCGSQGEVLEVRVTDCTSLPCTIKVGLAYTIEVDFIPSVAHQVLTFLISANRQGQEIEIFRSDFPYAVSPGNRYTVTLPWGVSGQFDTGLFNLRMEIMGNNGDVVEFCGYATVNFV